MAGFEWDELRYVLAVANAGSLAGAARSLGANHTTVLRRISAFEKRLGLRLFERLPTGYVLTAGGEELIAAARHIDDTVTNLERTLAGQGLRLSGLLSTIALRDTPRPQLSGLAKMPWWGWLGAFCGATYVTTMFSAIPVIGAAAAVGLTVAGQQIASLFADRYGWFRLPRREISGVRFGGVLLLAGVATIQGF
jgi:uncharacterized membrane protein YdcZ (DUF606 family)